MTVTVRKGSAADLDAVLAIQAAIPELPHWSPAALEAALHSAAGYDVLVAEADGRVAGFLLWLRLTDDETEILSLAVEESSRRKGLAKALTQRLFALRNGEYFLEVRASNAAALGLYEALGFERNGLRRAYYHRPVEDAVLMRKSEIVPKDEA